MIYTVQDASHVRHISHFTHGFHHGTCLWDCEAWNWTGTLTVFLFKVNPHSTGHYSAIVLWERPGLFICTAGVEIKWWHLMETNCATPEWNPLPCSIQDLLFLDTQPIQERNEISIVEDAAKVTCVVLLRSLWIHSDVVRKIITVIAPAVVILSLLLPQSNLCYALICR